MLFSGPVTSIGAFRCPVGHPAFHNSGPIERCVVVFPRTSVWIRHEGSRPFVADPNVVTIYNRAQRYERSALSPDGDRCDWFAIADQTAREIVAAFDSGAAEQERGPFTFQRAPSTPGLYLAQRRLMLRAEAGATDALETEEAVVGIVAGVLALAYQRVPRPLERSTTARRRQDLVEHAKAELVRTVAVNRSVAEVARAVGTSVFHLCRIFRACTGRTMHAYRSDLRLRLALELLSGAGTRARLSDIAHRVGFASHSHFVQQCRRHLGVTPGAVRAQLGTGD
ncbi:MAG TPA: AraC family transcriptional regulator [Gemmatimonadaceae bacterium]|nr:AraC family transcriptional regulator [Gemmatimonadaceae bacterium]